MEEARRDDFSLWYRFRTTVVFNLLYLAGPASLDDARNPRVQVEREYLRRKALHLAHKHGGPVEVIPLSSQRPAGIDPFVLMVVFAVVAVLFLLGWFVVAAR